MISAYRYFTGIWKAPTDAAESAFFASLRLANKTFKTTAAKRMAELDATVVRLALDRGWHQPAILDAGASSGVTTEELQDVMLSSGVTPSIIATDLTIDAAIFDTAFGVRVLADRSGHPLQYDFLGFGIRVWSRRLDYFTGYFLLTQLARYISSAWPRSRVLDVKLVSRKLTSQTSINVVEDDLTVRNPAFKQRFAIVRAANILNRGYFDSPTLRLMIDNLKSYCREPGALIVINRTHADGTNHGTVFETLANNSLRVVTRIGAGSEVEGLAIAPPSEEKVANQTSRGVAPQRRAVGQRSP